MRDLWKMIEALKEKKHMVRLAFFPGGTLNVAVYDSQKQMLQHMYDAHSYEELERLMRKDWGHLISASVTPITPVVTIPSPNIVTLVGMPRPAGFPRP